MKTFNVLLLRRPMLYLSWSILLSLICIGQTVVMSRIHHAQLRDQRTTVAAYQALLTRLVQSPRLSVLEAEQQDLRQQMAPHSADEENVQRLMQQPPLQIIHWQNDGESLHTRVHLGWSDALSLLDRLAQRAPRWQISGFTLTGGEANLLLELGAVKRDAP